MRHITKYLLTLFIFNFSFFIANAQVAINENGNAPDSSAMLDVSSSDKGVLIPRMSTIDRDNISNPATGLLVYDTITVSFWYYDDDQWNEIRNGNTALTASDIFDELPDLDFSCLEITGKLEFSGFIPFSLAVSGDYAYVGLGTGLTGEFRIIDISNPIAPSSISNLNIGRGVDDVAVSGDYAYILDSQSNSLRVIDVSDPTAPNLSTSLAIGSGPEEIVLSGNYAYIINTGNLKIIDISNPTAPSITSSLGIGSDLRSLDISNNYVYVVDSDSDDMKVVDVSDPAVPSLSGSLTIGDFPFSIDVSNNYAYVVDGIDGDIKIIDVSNPVTPSLSGSLVIGTFPNSIAVSGKYAYVTDREEDDMKIIDVSNPAAPSLSASLGLGRFPSSIELAGNYAYVIDGNAFDLRIIQRSCPNNVIAFNSADGTFETVLNSDDQTIDKLNLNGTTLEISLEDDGESDQTVDLASLQDDLGDHTATQNIQLNGNWLSNDGGNEGIQVNDNGGVSTSNALSVGGNITGVTNFYLDQGTQRLTIRADQSAGRIHFDVGGTNASNDAFVFGDLSNGKNALLTLGNVGVGTFSAPQKLTVGVSGDGTKGIANDWDTWSDKRLKRDFQEITNPLQKLNAINGYYYYWRADKPDQSKQIGVIAQEVETILPEIVSTNPDGYKSVDYSKLTAFLIEVNQAQQQEIDDLKAQVAKINQLEAMLERLEAQVSSNSTATNSTGEK